MDTGAIYIYNPLVITEGTTPAANPGKFTSNKLLNDFAVVPQLPANYVAAVWFGFNGNTLVLEGAEFVTVVTFFHT